ncbi:MAG: OmpA/MotB domain protein [Myxococcales bacterium]|nr:OmpA/MotB domain protein [Myxococcales bacterium]
MKWNLAASLLTVVVMMQAPPPADACGVKLTIKTLGPRKAVARTSNPSEVLLLGNPPRRLERDLSAAGHRVEVAPKASNAKKKQYAVVIVDSDLQEEARSNFASSVVIVRSGDVVADMRTVEKQVARTPVRAGTGREVVAAGPNREVTAAGPVAVKARQIVGAADPKEDTATETAPAGAVVKVAVKHPAEPTPKVVEAPKPPKVAEAPKPPVEEVTKPVVVEPKPVVVEPKPVAVATTQKPAKTEHSKPAAAAAALNSELYFGLGSASGNTSSLAKAVRWLSDNADAHVVIEGHADPTGNPDDNMALGQRRAEWARDYLVSAGVDSSRLEVISYGDTRLKYGKTDHRNRRVAIVPKQ